MHSDIFKHLLKEGKLLNFLLECTSPLSASVPWYSVDHFDWHRSSQGFDYWHNTLSRHRNCNPTEADIAYCKQTYPEYFI